MDELEELNLEAYCLEEELNSFMYDEYVDTVEVNSLINELYYVEELIRERRYEITV